MKDIKNYGYLENLEFSEYLAMPIYMIVILAIAFYIQNKNQKANPLYRYYTIGVFAKLCAGIGFCLVYIYVYKGGDTISYFESSRALTNLLEYKPGAFFKVMSETGSVENFYLFDARQTGYPWFSMYIEPHAFFVLKLMVPFMVLSFNSYLLATMLLSWVSFAGIWRLFLMFSKMYKEISSRLAISILFIPSVVFWGSGILKDTITLSASCWFIYSLFNAFIIKNHRLRYLIILFLSGFVIYSVKPYILFALLPGGIIWIVYDNIVKIKNRFFKYSFIPLVYVISIGGGYLILNAIGEFDIKDLIMEASVKQSDLKRAEYKGSSFDIGDYEPTINGAAAVSPAAIAAGLYRPYIWEAKNIVMALSGIENLVYLILSIVIIFRIRFLRFLKILFDNPLILFCLSYSIFFSLIVGLSTSNFGALVRFKIAFLPEFLSALFVLNYFMKHKTITKIEGEKPVATDKSKVNIAKDKKK